MVGRRRRRRDDRSSRCCIRSLGRRLGGDDLREPFGAHLWKLGLDNYCCDVLVVNESEVGGLLDAAYLGECCCDRLGFLFIEVALDQFSDDSLIDCELMRGYMIQL